MIGTFLVFVAAVCAVFRCWWDRLEDHLYKTEIGESVQVRDGHNVFWFVQYFLRGREFWWWTIGDEPTPVLRFRSKALLNQSLPKRRGHKVQKANLATIGDEIDVTKFLQQLSGPQGDFYRSLDEDQPALDADTVRAYLGLRLPAQHLPKEWLYITMEVVPGSVAPFKPIRFAF